MVANPVLQKKIDFRHCLLHRLGRRKLIQQFPLASSIPLFIASRDPIHNNCAWTLSFISRCNNLTHISSSSLPMYFSLSSPAVNPRSCVHSLSQSKRGASPVKSSTLTTSLYFRIPCCCFVLPGVGDHREVFNQVRYPLLEKTMKLLQQIFGYGRMNISQLQRPEQTKKQICPHQSKLHDTLGMLSFQLACRNEEWIHVI